MLNSDFDLNAIRETLPAVLSDVLDESISHQAMAPSCGPSMRAKNLVGFARTGLFMNTYSVREGENPYEGRNRLIGRPQARTTGRNLAKGRQPSASPPG